MMMKVACRIVWKAFVFLSIGSGAAMAADYPNKPIHVVTSEVGGASDIIARLVGQEFTTSLGQPVIVDNRPSGLIQGELVARAAPDGYTLLLTGPTFWLGPLMQSTPYDPVRDFVPIGLLVSGVNVVTVPLSLPVKSIKDLVTLAKSKPGYLNYGSTATGTASHLAAELFNQMAGTNIVRITYKGTPAAVNGLSGGQVQVMFASAPSVMPAVKAGQLRALAVTGAQRSAVVPDLPTISSEGLPGYEAVTTTGMFAPAKTPQSVISILNQAGNKAIEKDNVVEKFHNLGLEPIGGPSDVFASTIATDLAKWTKIIKDSGISSN